MLRAVRTAKDWLLSRSSFASRILALAWLVGVAVSFELPLFLLRSASRGISEPTLLLPSIYPAAQRGCRCLTEGTNEDQIFARHNRLRGSVLIVGAGAVGSSIALQLARLGVRLRFIDKSVLAPENIVRHQLGVEDLGQPKTVLAERIRQRLPWCEVDGIYADFTELAPSVRQWYLEEADVVIAATDEAEVQRFINHQCISAGKPVIFPGVWVDHLTGEAEAGEILWRDPRRGNMPCYECATSQQNYEPGDAQVGRGAQADFEPIVLAATEAVRGLLQPQSIHARFLDDRRTLILVRGFTPARQLVAEAFGKTYIRYEQVPFPLKPCPACGAQRPSAPPEESPSDTAPIDEIWGGTIFPPERPPPAPNRTRHFGIAVGFLALIAFILVVLVRIHSGISSAPEPSVPALPTAHWRIVCVNYTLPSQPNSPVTPCPGGQFGVYDPTDSLIRIGYEIQGMNSTYSELYARGSLKERVQFYSDNGTGRMIRICQNPHIDKTGKHFVFDLPGTVAKVVVEIYCNKRSTVCQHIGQVIWKGQHTTTILPIVSLPRSGSPTSSASASPRPNPPSRPHRSPASFPITYPRDMTIACAQQFGAGSYAQLGNYNPPSYDIVCMQDGQAHTGLDLNLFCPWLAKQLRFSSPNGPDGWWSGNPERDDQSTSDQPWLDWRCYNTPNRP